MLPRDTTSTAKFLAVAMADNREAPTSGHRARGKPYDPMTGRREQLALHDLSDREGGRPSQVSVDSSSSSLDPLNETSSHLLLLARCVSYASDISARNFKP